MPSNSLTPVKTLPRLFTLLVLLGAGLPSVLPLQAQTSTTNWNLSVLDGLLAAVPPGQKLARVGDMEILVSTLKAWRAQLAGGPAPLSAFDSGVPTWPGGNVFYTFDASVSVAQRRAFLDAAGEWATFANLHFIPRTNQGNYVTIKENAALAGGQSAVGMVGGEQFLQIGPNAWNRGTLCHELGHTLGLIHEHQRSDRDAFVTILTNNLVPGSEANFIKLGNSLNRSAYDFYSVMHYSRNALSSHPATLDTIHPQPAYSQFLYVMGGDHDILLSAADRAGMALLYGAGPAITNIVTNTQDSGPGSLRAALYYAYDHPGTTVTFNLSPADPGFSNSVFNILPTDQLPTLAHGTALDGKSQPTNANPNGPAITLNGALALNPSVYPQGLRLRGTNCTVRGLVINGFAAHGILITGSGATGNVVDGCYLGTDPSGLAAVPSGLTPITLADGAHDNLVGGTTAAAKNVISGSTYQGLVIRDSGTRYNTVQGNYLGLNATGSAALPNAWAGIAIYTGAQSNLVGGAIAGARNVISGNTLQGVTISDPDTTGNIVAGNFIGLNPAGTAALANGWAGVDVFGSASGNLIGGLATGARNAIAGNGTQGVAVSGEGTDGNLIQGNYLGLNATGTAAVPNAWAGVHFYGGAQSNTLGGTTAAARNVISGNGAQGVAISDTNTAGNRIGGNFIGVNPAGTAALANGWSGVDIYGGAQSNLIGGGPDGRNVLSGNGADGLQISGPGSENNLVQGNLLGLDATGLYALANSWAGVRVFGGASSNLIGGAAPGLGNVISGNAGQGLVLADTNTTGNVIAGNYVGLNGLGQAAVANAWSGIDIYGGATANLIGGGPGARNVISGNRNSGIAINGPGTTENRIQGNTIGLNLAATASVPNSHAGIVLFDAAQATQIGGPGFATANLIAGNLSGGVQMFDATTINNSVRGNSIFGNGGVGLGLYAAANRSAIAPSLSSAVVTTNLTITGSLSDLASTTFHLDFYVGGPGGFGPQARTYLGSADITTSSGGIASFTHRLEAVVPMGQFITATSTDPAGSTSPLCAAVMATGIDSIGDGLPNAWRSAYFGGSGTTTNSFSCATCDPDQDGLNNRQEFLAGTSPNDPTSALRMGDVSLIGSDVMAGFQSVSGIPYRLEVRADLSSGAWTLLADQFLGSGGLLWVTDPGAAGLPRRFYRVAAIR